MAEIKTSNIVYHRVILERWPFNNNPQFRVKSMTEDKKYSEITVFTDGAEPFAGRGKNWKSVPTKNLLNVDDLTEEDKKYEKTEI
jgi:hypothetical protein